MLTPERAARLTARARHRAAMNQLTIQAVQARPAARSGVSMAGLLCLEAS